MASGRVGPKRAIADGGFGLRSHNRKQLEPKWLRTSNIRASSFLAIPWLRVLPRTRKLGGAQERKACNRNDFLTFLTIRLWCCPWVLGLPSSERSHVRNVRQRLDFGPFGPGLVLWFWAHSHGLEGVRSERSETYRFRTFWTWPVCWPGEGP